MPRYATLDIKPIFVNILERLNLPVPHDIHEWVIQTDLQRNERGEKSDQIRIIAPGIGRRLSLEKAVLAIYRDVNTTELKRAVRAERSQNLMHMPVIQTYEPQQEQVHHPVTTPPFHQPAMGAGTGTSDDAYIADLAAMAAEAVVMGGMPSPSQAQGGPEMSVHGDEQTAAQPMMSPHCPPSSPQPAINTGLATDTTTGTATGDVDLAAMAAEAVVMSGVPSSPAQGGPEMSAQPVQFFSVEQMQWLQQQLMQQALSVEQRRLLQQQAQQQLLQVELQMQQLQLYMMAPPDMMSVGGVL